ncbi:hypothetical protein ABNF97_11185 [Plantactinospora sp. B6F1]|uniref:hypothetical protein n=1 Tax=Plantactinospora sp. B6F1 TaxID=3158971 RepID=UPI0032D8E777
MPFHGDLVSRIELWDQPTYYLGNTFTGAYDAAFYHRVEYFLEDWYYLLPDHWRNPMRINVLGVHVDKANSWHMYGRAIDFASISMLDSNGGNRFTAFECAVDTWGTKRDFNIDRRRYWAAVAAINYRSADVLHYLYNAEHRNHVHMDNGRSGTATTTTFNSGSPVLVKTVQACLTYIWASPSRSTASGGRRPTAGCAPT